MRIDSESWLQAQYSVLGAALISPEIVPRVMAETEADDFSGSCRTVYEAMAEVFKTGFPVDPVSVNHRLGESYRDFLVQLMHIVPTATNIDSYIAICREQARVLACRDIGKQMSEGESAETMRALAEKAMKALSSTQSKRTVSMRDSLRSFFEKAEKPVRCISWPIKELGDLLHVGAGKFLVLGAEPSVGKTAFALQCAWHWSTASKVGFFSFETDPDTLFERLVSCSTGIPMERITTNQLTRKEWDLVCQATESITRRKLDLISAAGMTVSDIRAKIMEAGYKIVIVDYLQIVTSRGGSRYEQVTNISIDLHILAQSLGVTVLALAQLSRTEEERTPRNSDLRESGQIEQDADVIMMLQLEKRSRPAGPRKLYITKNKMGELFQMLLVFDGKRQRFIKGSVLDSAVAEAAEMKKKFKPDPVMPSPSGAPVPGQMEILPQGTYTPFKE